MTQESKSPPKMRTINEIAGEYGLARHFVRQVVVSGKVVHVKAGNKYLINSEKFAEWLNTGEQNGQPSPQQPSNIRRIGV